MNPEEPRPETTTTLSQKPRRGRPPRQFPVTPAGEGIIARGNPDQLCTICGRPPPKYRGWATKLSKVDGRCRRCRNNDATKASYATKTQDEKPGPLTIESCLEYLCNNPYLTVEREQLGAGSECIVIARDVFREDQLALLRARAPHTLTRLIRRALKRRIDPRDPC